ncbi:MAG: DUF362 domain-containing protein [Actinobacteria bacterium]|nr:DUF362 domain-containing protein [Actinomycetota bacterium]
MPKTPHVVVAQNGEAYAGAFEALARASVPNLLGKTILLKPNAGRASQPLSGVTTNPQVVLAAIDFFQQHGAKVRVGESPILGVTAEQTFESTGITEVAKERVELVDLDARKASIVPVPNGRVLSEIRVCPDVLEADIVVSIPVMKTHMHTVVSLGLKNMKGCLHGREKVRLHQLDRPAGLPEDIKTLDAAIADLAGVLRPGFTLVDGAIGLEGLGPSAGSAKQVGLFVAGEDCLAVDAVAAHLMGFEPTKIPHLRLAAEQNGGCIDLDKIETEPTELDGLVNRFKPAPTELSVEYPGVVVHDCDSCSACLSTVVMLLERYHSELLDYAGPDKKVHIAMGKSVEDVPAGTLLIGNCTANKKAQGLFIKGCPPVASEILAAIKRNTK